MLSGILSDTLVLRSPTTTHRDRNMALKLAVFSGLVAADASQVERESVILALGAEILSASSGLGQRPAEQVVLADLKTYTQDGLEFAIAQVEVPGFAELEERVGDLQQALEDLRERKGLNFTMLLVTDIVRATSRVMVAGPPRLFDGLPYQRRLDGTLEAAGVVSRKKQLLPAVTAAIEAQ
jgi:manganese-dependent inorganic pyrophosphatase